MAGFVKRLIESVKRMAELKVKPRPGPGRRRKTSYVGAPAIFKLEHCCSFIVQSFDCYGVYLVGSAIERPDWRDVDLRMIMSDEAFRAEFPNVHSLSNASWEHDHRWLLLTISISSWISAQTGLPVDFQFQPATFANERHGKPRKSMGFALSRRTS